MVIGHRRHFLSTKQIQRNPEQTATENNHLKLVGNKNSAAY